MSYMYYHAGGAFLGILLFIPLTQRGARRPETMKAHIETINGKVTLKVFYNPALCNWDEAIAVGLASFGLKQGQAAVLAFPFPRPVGIGRPENRPSCILQEKNR